MTNTVREGFAERLKLALYEAGKANSTQRELGKLFRVSPQAVRKWQAGEAMPSSSRAPGVAQQLGVRKAWLIDGELPIRAQAVTLGESGNQYAVVESELSISGEEYLLLVRFRRLEQPVKLNLSKLLEVLAPDVKS